jgi:hypothetical protein
MNRKREKELDRVLTGEIAGDDELGPLEDVAHELDRALAVETPPARRERAMFVHSVGGRSRKSSLALRVAIPAAVALGVIALATYAGNTATPGEALFPVREALARAGLASTPLEDVNRLLDEAAESVERSEAAEELSPEAATRHAEDAIYLLHEARRPLTELSGEQREVKAERLEDLRERAIDVLGETSPAAEERQEELEDLREERQDLREERQELREERRDADDSSGPGSGDEDNSGPGSDDSGDDNSGPGSDDSGGDNSGPGSDDSGSGSDDSGSGSDNSGSGSDDDSSGSG